MNYFVTGIGTNVGKTVVAAILAEALKADYWKPVQSGATEGSDSETVRLLISNPQTVIHPESYVLALPVSPNIAAKAENVEINVENICLPATQNYLIIEGAGGLLVPLNDTLYVCDLAKKFNTPVILVVKDYLGCINHTMLSVNYLLQHKYTIYALVFNGDFSSGVKEIISGFCKNLKIINLPEIKKLSAQSVLKVARNISGKF